ncbi:MAG: hypothetical protein HPY53_16595 [Brevinematales bacterium]|nr:hypothetical protein [Brevinematales bacterium]
MKPLFITIIICTLFSTASTYGEEYNDPQTEEIHLGELIPAFAYKSFASSSTLKAQGANSYTVKNLIDGDLRTCWSEGVKGYGVGEWVEFEFHEDTTIDVIAIANGYLKNEYILEKNSSVWALDIYITTYDGDKHHETLYFDRPEFWQTSVETEEEVMHVCRLFWIPEGFGGTSIKSIRFQIADVYHGTKYDDTCISEIFFYGSVVGYGESYYN